MRCLAPANLHWTRARRTAEIMWLAEDILPLKIASFRSCQISQVISTIMDLIPLPATPGVFAMIFLTVAVVLLPGL